MRFLAFSVFVTLLVSVSSLSCPNDCSFDRPRICGPEPTCRRPPVYDACGCCRVCLKELGEFCGGPWNVLGRCAPGLVCDKGSSLDRSFMARGICRVQEMDDQ